MKSMAGVVSKDIIVEMYNASTSAFSVFTGDRLAYCLFCVPTGKGDWNIYLCCTTLGYDEYSLNKILNDLQKNNLYVIVYKDNKKLLSVVKKVGFRFSKNLIYGLENKKYLLLKR